jgi:hypothetical protein
MVNRLELLADLKSLVKAMEADLRVRCDEMARIDEDLKKEYEQARAAERTGVTFEEWRGDLITQVAVAWVLSCVFVRFLEDNALIAPPRISGPLHGAGDGQGLTRARDEWDIYLHNTPDPTHRGYLLTTFDDLAKLPGTKDVFGPHNPVSAYRNWLSGDAAQTLIEFFQKIDTDGTGEIVHDFRGGAKHEGTKTRREEGTEEPTRFLGDLYQDLSEAARKKYALLQTPVFVEEFILERTLEPAIQEFGLKDFKMIDPACGSGHFLLGAFARILKHWRSKEPGTSERELVNRALASVHGVDLNPYAVAIARFRLLVAAMRECQIAKLEDAPAFAFNLVCGDSLLHGAPGAQQQVLGFDELAHAYQSENLPELKRILKAGQYHAVVANPPYITVKDKALNQAYRERYPQVCHMKYSLAVPFLQRLFVLACEGGYTGQITANSFMKREFGKKLVESYLPKIDLTHVIDTSGAYIPGHGTPTVILFGRNCKPVAPTIRAVMGIKGEPSTPDDPSQGLVWTAITEQIDQVGSQSAFVSVNDTPREQFGKHPWSIGGGGAAELKEFLDEVGDQTRRHEDTKGRLGEITDSIGITSFTLEDDVFLLPPEAAKRHNIPALTLRPMIVGDIVRDWTCGDCDATVFPYTSEFQPIDDQPMHPALRYLWLARTGLSNNMMFGGKRKVECGMRWYEYGRLTSDKLRTSLSIVFGEVTTHNHFVLDRGGKVFNRTAPVIKLPAEATEGDHLALLGLLNSSTACFWLKQACHSKGSTVDDKGARQRTAPFEDFFAFNATRLEQFPLPADRPLALARKLDELAGLLSELSPSALLRTTTAELNRDAVAKRRLQWEGIRQQMISLQEELDWQCYALYALLPPSRLRAFVFNSPPPIALGHRAFEIVLARKVAAGEEETTWFARHGSTPITEFPADWPEAYRQVVQRRIEMIESNPNIALIERPEYKRRWNTEPWDQQQERALRGWLLDRLESYFDFDGRLNTKTRSHEEGNSIPEIPSSLRAFVLNPCLTSVAAVADVARADKDFMQVAELFTGRMDFDVGTLMAELVAAESVPALPVLRYKPAALDKRAAWERTWELQRLEDAVDALFDQLTTKARSHEEIKLSQPVPSRLRDFVVNPLDDAAKYLAEAVHQNLDLTSDVILQPVHDAAKRAKKAAVGDIPVPPKYTSADFLSSNVWRLRGKLDVPKERWVSFPYCEGEDGTLVIAWAGYDHLQLVQAIAERYELAKEQEGRKLVPLLATIGQLIPWLKQWHNEIDPVYGTRMGDYFEGYLAEESKALGLSVEQVTAWTPPEKPKKAGRKKK